MAMDETDRLRALSKRVAKLEARQTRARAELGVSLVGVAVAAMMCTLTAVTWFTREGQSGTERLTLWGLVPENSFTLLTLLLVLGTGIATLGAFASGVTGRPGYMTHVVLMATSVLTVNAVMLVSKGADVAGSGPARWLTLVCALALVVMHGGRSRELSASRRVGQAKTRVSTSAWR